jgi:predicted phage gp36 major capsid-like protein
VTLAQVRSQAGSDEKHSQALNKELQSTLSSFEKALEDVSEGAKQKAEDNSEISNAHPESTAVSIDTATQVNSGADYSESLFQSEIQSHMHEIHS